MLPRMSSLPSVRAAAADVAEASARLRSARERRNRLIVEAVLGDGVSQIEVAHAAGVSPVQVLRILTEAPVQSAPETPQDRRGRPNRVTSM